MLKNILSITGKTGLFRLVSRGNNMLIVESLLDGKRIPTYARDKVVSLAEISMFTTGDDIALSEVLTKVGAKNQLQALTWDVKKADNDQLRNEFAAILPDFDRDRVYPSDIRKLFAWYNILVAAGITDFTVEEDQTAAPIAAAEKQDTPKPAPKAQGKTQKSAVSSVKTGVGAKKG